MEKVSKTLKNSVTPKEQRILTAALSVRNEPPVKTFLASQLVQCTLPHSNPGPVEWWSRSNGNLTLSIRSGGNPVTQTLTGIPYGIIPRLLLFWINTEAARTKSRRLELGSNLSEFMRQLDLNPSGRGSRSDAKRLKEQMARLFGSTISLTVNREDRPGARAYHRMQVSESGTDDSFQWWDASKPDQGSLWTESVELSEKFYQCITEAPVPGNMLALKALRSSSMLLDLYWWVIHRSYAARKRGEMVQIAWSDLSKQLGAEYSSQDEFARKTRIALAKIKAVYPGLEFQVKYGSLGILPESQLAIEE